MNFAPKMLNAAPALDSSFAESTRFCSLSAAKRFAEGAASPFTKVTIHESSKNLWTVSIFYR
jgi:hypothetical protein